VLSTLATKVSAGQRQSAPIGADAIDNL